MKLRLATAFGPVLLMIMAPSPGHAASAAASPQIDGTAIRAIDFVPSGWKLYDKVEGDLDGDGDSDAAIVIQRNDPALIIRNPDGLGVPEFDSNPRVLLVALLDNQDFVFRLVARNNRIIPDWDSPTISDPYSGLAIEDGKLTLYIEFFANAGTWFMSNNQFHFRSNGERMELIGYDFAEVQRNTGDMKTISVNYLTHRRKDGIGRTSSDELAETWSTLPAGRRPAFGDIGNAFEFEP